jgi:hypothetical protein
VPVDAARLLDRLEILAGGAGESVLGDRERFVEARHIEPADERPVLGDEPGDGFVGRGLADEVGHVEREEIARFEERIDGVEADVVGIDEVRTGPAAGFAGGVGLNSHVAGRAAHDRVLAVRLVPHGGDLDTPLFRAQEGVELRGALMCEPVADADGVFWWEHYLRSYLRDEILQTLG